MITVVFFGGLCLFLLAARCTTIAIVVADNHLASASISQYICHCLFFWKLFDEHGKRFNSTKSGAAPRTLGVR